MKRSYLVFAFVLVAVTATSSEARAQDKLDDLNHLPGWYFGLGPLGLLDLQVEHDVQVPGLIQVGVQGSIGWNSSDDTTVTWPWSVGGAVGYPLRWRYASKGYIPMGGGVSTSDGKTTLSSVGKHVPVPGYFEVIPEVLYQTVPKDMAFASNEDTDGRYHMLGAGIRLQVRKSARTTEGTAYGYWSVRLRYYPVVAGGDLVDSAFGATIDVPFIGSMKARLQFVTTPDEDSELQMLCVGFGYGYSDEGIF